MYVNSLSLSHIIHSCFLLVSLKSYGSSLPYVGVIQIFSFALNADQLKIQPLSCITMQLIMNIGRRLNHANFWLSKRTATV